jgi:hypothetical protein
MHWGFHVFWTWQTNECSTGSDALMTFKEKATVAGKFLVHNCIGIGFIVASICLGMYILVNNSFFNELR